MSKLREAFETIKPGLTEVERDMMSDAITEAEAKIEMLDKTAHAFTRMMMGVFNAGFVPESENADLPDFIIGTIDRQKSENERLRAALTRLRDCDWVISLPDRMDAVRDIARAALENKR